MSEGAYQMPGGMPEPWKLPRKRNQPTGPFEVQLRALKALRMHKSGYYTLQQIADELGYKNATAVRQLIKKALRDVTLAEAADYQEWILAQQMKQLQITQETIEHPGFKYDIKGMWLVGPGGRPEMDLDVRTKAQTEFRHNVESVRRLIGLDAPVKRHVTVEQQARQELIEKYIAELRATPVPPPLELEPGDIVEGELGDQERSGESDEAAGESPRDPDVAASGSERSQQKQDDGGDEQDNPER